MSLTPTRQRNTVSQGIALGLLLCGFDSMPYNKMRIDLAFTGAWRGWAYRDRFPQIGTDISKGLDGVHAMTRADKNKQAWLLYWENVGAEFHIYTRDPDWTPENSDDRDYALTMLDADIPLSGWEELARDFIERFQR